jgi:hypothetical protein
MQELESKNKENNFLRVIWLKFRNLDPKIQGAIILILMLLIGIIIRWSFIIESVIRSFNFFSK